MPSASSMPFSYSETDFPSSHEPATAVRDFVSVPLGQVVTVKNDPFAPPAFEEIFYDALQEFYPHKNRPWLIEHLRQRHSLDITPPQAGPAHKDLTISEELLARHAVICGSAGSGKTRLALLLLKEQLRAGHSAVVFDFKMETIQQVLYDAQEAGLSSEQITLLWPQEDSRGIPGWNPFAGGFREARQAVRQFVSIIEASTSSWGPRLKDVLTTAATIIAGQRLSILELMRFLQSEEYREGLLRQARKTPAWEEFAEEHTYFVTEFAGLTKGERGSAVAPVLNKIRTLVSNKYLRAMLCAENDTLDLPSLWHRQRLILVHLDSYALGTDGAKLLSGMLAYHLFNTAMSKSGPNPVVLALDEMGMQERFVGGAITDILAMARSQKLRMLAACQHLDQLSDSLRQGLLTNTALRVFFRLGPDDARKVSQVLATGTGGQATKISLNVTRPGKYEEVDTEKAVYTIVDPHSREMKLSDEAWMSLKTQQQKTTGSDSVDILLLDMLTQMQLASGISRLYAKARRTGDTHALTTLLKNLPRSCYAFHGPVPLRVVVVFPRPKVAVLAAKSESERTSEMSQALSALPVRQAVVRTDQGLTARILVRNNTYPANLPNPLNYLHGGQQEARIRATYQQRRAQVEALSGGMREERAFVEADGEAEVGETPVRTEPRHPTSARREPAKEKPVRTARPKKVISIEPEVADDGSL